MKDSIRLFVAATLPETLKQELHDQLQVYDHPSIRPVPLQNLHLTLFFLGNVPVQQLAAIQQSIQEVAQRRQPFTLDFEFTEPGPKPRHPRLIWARFAAHPAFEALSYELTEALADEPPKKQKAIPHVTLARFRKDKPVPENLFTITAKEPLQLHVSDIALWQSELASPHPVYSVLETYPLG
ncbi:RNA 2',3'-cyclic phosphodiesterase [Pontibacter diazotrophicus]|uniref:RNA 2',3'-cyclic phosphodiesterase n=1 Tax=Pontibacter diazotrophicus TaxID=1400979 RepID=A0A3D8LBI0_9BACT|nr:RNA 2',3'-cyclic phosphodiesterase [Pontibacter diazotrophicus]RDV14654.1 RNA 2',3'-cyclic phosphodiesterase [Pontibacter diazotrophicus]